jgi:prepilin-type N-terminal cleavage/methylation domain-containing protein
MEERDEGFTLIELLVVIIIIGILAAIAIPVFLSQRNKGYDSQAKSDARNIGTLEETYFNDNNYYQAGGALAAVQGALPDYKKSGGVSAVVLTAYPAPSGSGATTPNTTTLNGSFCVDVQSQSGSHFYYNSKTGGLTTTACPTTQ